MLDATKKVGDGFEILINSANYLSLGLINLAIFNGQLSHAKLSGRLVAVGDLFLTPHLNFVKAAVLLHTVWT